VLFERLDVDARNLLDGLEIRKRAVRLSVGGDGVRVLRREAQRRRDLVGRCRVDVDLAVMTAQVAEDGLEIVFAAGRAHGDHLGQHLFPLRLGPAHRGDPRPVMAPAAHLGEQLGVRILGRAGRLLPGLTAWCRVHQRLGPVPYLPLELLARCD